MAEEHTGHMKKLPVADFSRTGFYNLCERPDVSHSAVSNSLKLHGLV